MCWLEVVLKVVFNLEDVFLFDLFMRLFFVKVIILNLVMLINLCNFLVVFIMFVDGLFKLLFY